jgi:hypothetical protein
MVISSILPNIRLFLVSGIRPDFLQVKSGIRLDTGSQRRSAIRCIPIVYLFSCPVVPGTGIRLYYDQVCSKTILVTVFITPSPAPHPTFELTGNIFPQSIPLTQCCGSGMFYPGSRIRIRVFVHPGSRIPDPGSRIPDPSPM